jgi:hypothetical protein
MQAAICPTYLCAQFFFMGFKVLEFRVLGLGFPVKVLEFWVCAKVRPKSITIHKSQNP